MAQINPRTFADAKQLADGLYELILTNWGNRGQAQDPNNGSIIFPPVADLPGPDGIIPPVPIVNGVPVTRLFAEPTPSLFAIAISPRSMVDRCILQLSTPQVTSRVDITNSQPMTFPQPNIIKGGGILETEQLLAVGAPLVGQLNGPIIIRADSTHWFTDALNTDTALLLEPYGTALGNINGAEGRPIFIDPELRLLLYFTSRGTLPPQKRAPLRYQWSVFLGGDPDELVRVIPIMGRRSIGIAVRNSDPLVAHSFRVTGSWHRLEDPQYIFPNPEIESDLEVPLLASMLVPPLSQVFVTINVPQPGISFLLLRGTDNGGVVPILAFAVEADD